MRLKSEGWEESKRCGYGHVLWIFKIWSFANFVFGLHNEWTTPLNSNCASSSTLPIKS